MTQMTLARHLGYEKDDVRRGVLLNMVSTSSFFEKFPVDQIPGNALSYHQEQANGSMENICTSLEGFFGDCKEDVKQVARTAKRVGRVYLNHVAEVLNDLCEQKIQMETPSFKVVDDLINKLDGNVNFIAANGITLEKITKPAMEAGSMSDPNCYRGIPLLKNDFINLNPVQIFVGRFDDGTRSEGLAGIASDPMVEVRSLDDDDVRVQFYGGVTLFNQRALACAEMVPAEKSGGFVLNLKKNPFEDGLEIPPSAVGDAGCNCGFAGCNYYGSASCRHVNY